MSLVLLGGSYWRQVCGICPLLGLGYLGEPALGKQRCFGVLIRGRWFRLLHHVELSLLLQRAVMSPCGLVSEMGRAGASLLHEFGDVPGQVAFEVLPLNLGKGFLDDQLSCELSDL